MLLSCLYEHQKKAIKEQNKHKKCLINMWCGTGKTRTFTIDLFINSEKTNVIEMVFNQIKHYLKLNKKY